MPEAVRRTASRFARPRRGTYPEAAPLRAHTRPWTPWTRHQPAVPAAPRAPSGRGGRARSPRRGGRARPPGLRRPGGRADGERQLRHHRSRLGARHRHVAVGRLRLRQARLDVQADPQALLHGHRLRDPPQRGRPRAPAQRSQEGPGVLPQRVHRLRRRHDADDPRRRRRRSPPGPATPTTWSPATPAQDFAIPPTFTPSKGSLRILTATDLGDYRRLPRRRARAALEHAPS